MARLWNETVGDAAGERRRALFVTVVNRAVMML
jgi:hypothetical protein